MFVDELLDYKYDSTFANDMFEQNHSFLTLQDLNFVHYDD